jgi:hypothetical protein
MAILHAFVVGRPKSRRIYMIKRSVVFGLFLSVFACAGCAADSSDGGGEGVGATKEAWSVAPFQSVYYRKGTGCERSLEVMMGINWGQQWSICAPLSAGWTVYGDDWDFPPGTQVPLPGFSYSTRSPYMHGCRSGYFINQIVQNPFGGEDLHCVKLAFNGTPVDVYSYSWAYVDGYGPGNDGTQSTVWGLGIPRMHQCPDGYAMAGFHQSWNDLYCALP